MNRDEFRAAVLRNPVVDALLDDLLELAVPDAWVVSGCLVQTVWNQRTCRPVAYGINDEVEQAGDEAPFDWRARSYSPR